MRFSERDSREDEADRKRHDRELWRLFRADVEFAVYRRGGDVYSLDRDWLHDAMLAGKSVEETADAALARQRRSVEAYYQQRAAAEAYDAQRASDEALARQIEQEGGE